MQATQTALAFPANDASRYPTDADLRGYDRAQSFAKMITATVAARLEIGMSERDATAITYDVFKENGIHDHWHMPVIGVAEDRSFAAS